MRLADIADTVGQFVDLDEGRGQIVGTAGWSPCYSLIRLEDGSTTCRQTAHILPMLSTNRRSTAVPTATKSRPKKSPAKAPPVENPALQEAANGDVEPPPAESPAKSRKAAKKPAAKTKLAVAMEGSDAELAEFLLANRTYPDKAWSSRAGGHSRLPKETREAFIRRVLLGEEGSP